MRHDGTRDAPQHKYILVSVDIYRHSRVFLRRSTESNLRRHTLNAICSFQYILFHTLTTLFRASIIVHYLPFSGLPSKYWFPSSGHSSYKLRNPLFVLTYLFPSSQDSLTQYGAERAYHCPPVHPTGTALFAEKLTNSQMSMSTLLLVPPA